MFYALIAVAFVIPNALALYVIAREMICIMMEIQDGRGCEPVTITSERN